MPIASMIHAIAIRLFFTKDIIIEDSYGGRHVAVGVYSWNWFGRNLPLVVLGGWAALMLVFALIRA